MKATELIKRLQELVEEYGDLDVWAGESDIKSIGFYTDGDYEWFCTE